MCNYIFCVFFPSKKTQIMMAYRKYKKIEFYQMKLDGLKEIYNNLSTTRCAIKLYANFSNTLCVYRHLIVGKRWTKMQP
jgi:hypothetical protein